MSDYEWMIRVELKTGEVHETAKGSERNARDSYEYTVRQMRKSDRTVKVELLSRPVGAWGVVDSAEAS